MEISTALGDYTHSTTQCTKIPNYLSRALGLGPVTLAIIDSSLENAPQIALLASSLENVTAENAAFSAELFSLYQATLTERSKEILPPATGDSNASGEVRHTSCPTTILNFPKAQIFAQEMDDSHRMLLIVHERRDTPEMSEEMCDSLLLIASQLSKLLRCIVACTGNANILGGCFDRLTEREWMVLRVLNSGDGEKQLADQLRLSPHTLHSHIKSIYRKIGVQGRLSLLLRLREAQQDLRLATLSAPHDAHLDNACAMN
jgi:DNA-binding CsgD family transcriptional regulator